MTSQTLDIDAARAASDADRVFLADLLLACTVSGIVVVATYGVLEHGLRAHAVGAARAESQQAARAALVRLAREIRVAGFGAGEDFTAVAVAESSRIDIVSDLDADGATTGRGEIISWRLVDATLRRSAGAGAQPVADGVRVLAFRYFDAEGLSTTVAADVRVVEITLETEAATAASGLAAGVATRLATRVRLRNR